MIKYLNIDLIDTCFDGLFAYKTVSVVEVCLRCMMVKFLLLQRVISTCRLANCFLAVAQS